MLSISHFVIQGKKESKLKVPPKQQNEQKLMAWQPTEPTLIHSLHLFSSREIPGLLSSISIGALWTSSSCANRQLGHQAYQPESKHRCKIPSEDKCAMLISILQNKVLPSQGRGWSGARTAACPL